MGYLTTERMESFALVALPEPVLSSRYRALQSLDHPGLLWVNDHDMPDMLLTLSPLHVGLLTARAVLQYKSRWMDKGSQPTLCFPGICRLRSRGDGMAGAKLETMLACHRAARRMS